MISVAGVTEVTFPGSTVMIVYHNYVGPGMKSGLGTIVFNKQPTTISYNSLLYKGPGIKVALER